jgi:hypothetical protein
MQDFIDQANKNGTILLDKGRCQFCGADYQKGIFECMDNYNNGIQFLDFNNSEHHISRFLSNHFHLTRLNLILDKKQTWDYKKSPLLSNYLNVYKQNRPNEFLAVPKPLDRGKITVKDLTKATTSVECVEQIKIWADEVYHSWSSNHSIVSQIADGFLNNYYNRKTANR